MKQKYIITAFFVLMMSVKLLSQKKVVKEQKVDPFQTQYFSFKSNVELNAHLFLYNKAMACKFRKVHNDSLAFYSFKDKLKLVQEKDLLELNSVLAFYKDSLLGKDLLFDSLMRDFSDKLGKAGSVNSKWQSKALEKINVFQPVFIKVYWQAIDEANKAWLKSIRPELTRLETIIVPELERIYQTRLPEGKILVDLTSYATWSGAYSYDDRFCHVVFSTAHHSNQGDLAAEVIFHETSHFLVTKLEQQIKEAAKGKDIKQSINLWHNIIFYTTGYVLQKQYADEGKTFVPYYVQMKFEDKFPDFKDSVEACKRYWDEYCLSKATMEEAVKNIVNSVTEIK